MKKRLPSFHVRPGQPVFPHWSFCFCILLFFSFCFSHLANAQSKIWDKTIGGPANDDLTSMQQTSDGGYLLAGTSKSRIGGEKTQDSQDEIDINISYYRGDYWVVKLNPDRTKAWDKRYGGSTEDFLTAAIQTQDGGYILAGTSNSPKSGDKSQDNHKGQYGSPSDYWIVRLRPDGSKIWDRTIGGNANENLTAIVQTQDGGFILGGTSFSGTSGDKSQPSKGSADYWIVKLKADGTKVWDKSIGGKSEDHLQAMRQTSDGGFVLGGISKSGKGGDKSESRRDISNGSFTPTFDYWVVKLKADGTKTWDKTIGANKNDYLQALQQTQDGGYILGGTSNSDSSGEKTEAKKDNTKDYSKGDFWVVKLNAAGKKIWDRTIGGTESDELRSIQQTQDGGYILGGQSASAKSGDKTEERKYGYWMVKLNQDGVKTGDKTISSQSIDHLSSVKQTPDGNYLLGGTSYSRISGDKSEDNRDKLFYNGATSDFWIVKVNNQFRQNQELTFSEIPTKTTTDAPFTLEAKSSTGLPVTLEVVAGPATIKDNKLTLTGAGEVTVKAMQAGNAIYNPVIATRTFTVLLASQQQDFSYGGNRADTLTTMLAIADGGYLLAGTSASGVSGDKTQTAQDTTDFWLVKTDQSGKKLWDKTFGGNGLDKPTTLVTTPDGGYLLGGSSTSGISGQKSQASQGQADFWVIKLDAQGNKQWDKTYGGRFKSDFLQASFSAVDFVP